VLHGRETGVIKRLPHGEFIEVHAPLSQQQLHLLTSHEQYRPLSAEGADGTGRIGRTQRLRFRLSRSLHGDGAQIPKATAGEFRKVLEEHRK
jgi:ubiquinol-cytochrome c reductase cytochrome b subunit